MKKKPTVSETDKAMLKLFKGLVKEQKDNVKKYEEKQKKLKEIVLNEKWEDIPGYEGLYQVSDKGRVKNFDRVIMTDRGERNIKGRILTPNTNKAGYVSVKLSDGNKQVKKIDIHRLVAITFIDNPEGKPCVNHIDGNKGNNNVENLEWCTHKENIQHAIREGLFKLGTQRKNTKLTAKQVRMIRNSTIKNVELAKLFDVSEPTISRIKNNKRQQYVI